MTDLAADRTPRLSLPSRMMAGLRERSAFRATLRRLLEEAPERLVDVGFDPEAAAEEATRPFWRDVRLKQVFRVEPEALPPRRRRRPPVRPERVTPEPEPRP